MKKRVVLQEKPRVIVIVGPTAVGKSALAVTLARRLGGEIISADSRQVYRGMNIGTGKITKKEMRGVPHHLLDVANPKKQFSVAEYQTLAQKEIEEITSRGKLPIICGGTGLYIDAALGRVIIPDVPPDPVLRRKLEKKSTEALFTLLTQLDPQRAKSIDAKNPRRLIRAIEIAMSLEAKCFFRGLVERSDPRTFAKSILWKVFWIGLTLPPELLKQKIKTRLVERIKNGMIAEVKKLHQRGMSWRRLDELGLEYRYLSRYLRGLMTKKEMTEKLQTEIWRYTKRQMQWFKRNKEIAWFYPSQKAQIYAMLKRRGD